MTAYARARPSGHWLDYPDTTYGVVPAATFEQWDQAVYDVKTLLTNTQQLTSATYGASIGFGNVAGGFGFSGTGTPADIYAPFVIYQRYGAATPNANITKTTQGGLVNVAYYGPTIDDSQEAFSTAVLLKDTGTPYTQALTVTGFEGSAQIEGGNTATGNFVGAAGRLRFQGATSHVNTGIGVYSTYDTVAGATVGNYYAFYQSTAGIATNNWTLYGQDVIQSESQIRVQKSSDASMDFRVNRAGSGGGNPAFVFAQNPAGTDFATLRMNGITGQTHALTEWWISGATSPSATVSAGGNFIANGGAFIAQTAASVSNFRIDSSGLRWLVSSLEQTTVGAAGAASALPAAPTKYLKVKDSAGTTLVIPAYASA